MAFTVRQVIRETQQRGKETTVQFQSFRILESYTKRTADRCNCSESYQFEPRQRDCREVNGAPLSDIDKASFQHSDGTQHMNPPVWKANMK